MQNRVGFDHVGLDRLVGDPIEEAEGMNKARVRTDHPLQFESPVEIGRGAGERSLEGNDGLVEQGLVRSVSEKPAKILSVGRLIRVECDAAFQPSIKLETRLRGR